MAPSDNRLASPASPPSPDAYEARSSCSCAASICTVSSSLRSSARSVRTSVNAACRPLTRTCASPRRCSISSGLARSSSGSMNSSLVWIFAAWSSKRRRSPGASTTSCASCLACAMSCCVRRVQSSANCSCSTRVLRSPSLSAVLALVASSWLCSAASSGASKAAHADPVLSMISTISTRKPFSSRDTGDQGPRKGDTATKGGTAAKS